MTPTMMVRSFADGKGLLLETVSPLNPNKALTIAIGTFSDVGDWLNFYMELYPQQGYDTKLIAAQTFEGMHIAFVTRSATSD